MCLIAQDSQLSVSTETEVDIMSVSVDEDGSEVLKGGREEVGKMQKEMRDGEEKEGELFTEDSCIGEEKWARDSRSSRESCSDEGENTGCKQVRQ